MASKSKKETKAIETKATENAEVKEVKTNETKRNIVIMNNEELKELFRTNGLVPGSNAKSDSVVYNQFGTQSRVLQQKRSYQLLLTNGHTQVKGEVIDTDNDDTARFMEWYDTLTDEDKTKVEGYADINTTKLCASELPRERTVKITDYDLLVKFLKFMSSFSENTTVKEKKVKTKKKETKEEVVVAQ